MKIWGRSKRLRRSWALAALAAAMAWGSAEAAGLRIVAVGASNTAGKGVSSTQAWPARLEALLRARGISVDVVNAGVNGDDTGRMLTRLDGAIPAGTAAVILDKAASNDRRRGINTAANLAAITAKLRGRGIKVIVIEGMHGWAERQLQPDGTHITPEGHAAVAARLLPLVTAALRKR